MATKETRSLVWIMIKLALLLCCLLTHFATPLQAEPIDYKAVFKKAAPSVVVIFGSSQQLASKGTGSIITADGLVLTNTHVVTNEGKIWDEIYIYLIPDRLSGEPEQDLSRGFQGKVLALNPEYDLALVQIINPPNGLTPLPLSDLSQIEIGESTLAIGHPAGGALWTLTTGQIGAQWKNYSGVAGWDVFQTETSLNPGNSGGPLLDGSGAIVGVNTFIMRQNKAGLALTGLNFAVKSTTAQSWISQVIGELPSASSVSSPTKAAPTGAKVVDAPPNKPEEGNKVSFLTDAKGAKRSPKAIPIPQHKAATYQGEIKPGMQVSGMSLQKSINKIQNINQLFSEDSFYDDF